LRDQRKDQRRRDIPQINEKIGYSRMQVIDDDGENLGVLSRLDALARAREESLDLVLLSDSNSDDGLPVVKIMDFGKMLYSKKKKLSDAKKKQKVIKIKEVKFRPKIDPHDYQTKINRAIQFLNEGNRVKFTIMFRGRELATKEERGRFMFGKLDETLRVAGVEGVERERDMKLGNFWSRVYYIKSNK
jgi:translation initiation factor IF-3